MKRLIFFLLYFSEGAPIGFIWWALPTFLEGKGFSVTEIATVSAVATTPWTLKFILAPFVDIITMKILSLKKQLLIYQLLMGSVLVFMPQAVDSGNLQYIVSVILFHGFFASLQDICIDALAIKTIPENELGKINGIMQAGMLVGRSLFGGAGVFIMHKLGFSFFIYFLMSSIWVSLVFLQRTKVSTQKIDVPLKQYFYDFINIIKGKTFWTLVTIAYFAGFSYNGISTISSAMLSKFGASPILHGLTYSIFLPLSMTTGALLAGIKSDQKSPQNILQLSLAFCILFSIVVGGVYDYFPHINFIVVSYICFYFFIGSTTASLYSFLMRLTSKEFAALEFSIFMGIVNLSDSSVSYLTGQLVSVFNYTSSALIVGAFSSLCFLVLRKRKV